ncbi:RNA-binding domain-containing protein [Auricularia subglabra TFB-10046 SS5]|nr:RNA-binding domain-containing protein [Auricularia subglabra TFB-10046 SS5]
MTRRLYLGRIPTDARSEDVQKFFEGYGRIVDCRVMTGFGFVEFESSKDAEEVVQVFNGKAFMGAPILVEFAKENRPRRDDDRGYGGGGAYPPRARRPPGVRLIVSGISRDTSWQDLKDFGREAGNITFADIDRDVPGQGVLEYMSRDDADHAVKTLDGKDLRGQPVRVALASGDDRGGLDRGRDRDDRYRDDRGGYRGRSRSPPRREPYDRDRRPRSPPRRDRSPGRDYDRDRYDDRRGSGGGGGAPDYDRRRDDRRDDRGRNGY